MPYTTIPTVLVEAERSLYVLHSTYTYPGVIGVSRTKERYIVNEQGQRVAVILPLEEYEWLQEDLHDLATAAERRDEPAMSLAELKKRLG